MAHIGCPVVGDQTYGSGFKTREQKLSEKSQILLKNLKRQALHAYLLGFEHPNTGESLVFESTLPRDFADLLDSLTDS
jgi:23S rRNA pseudouridine1911/1915/1917 synthase